MLRCFHRRYESHDPQSDTHYLQTKTDEQASAAELDTALEDLINTISNKFAGLSSEIFAKSPSSWPLEHLTPNNC